MVIPETDPLQVGGRSARSDSLRGAALRSGLKVGATYMNIYSDVWQTNCRRDGRDHMARGTELHTDGEEAL